MTRLWDKGTPLDARVLAFTAGDDHVLDNRLVRYDIQASIPPPDMLAAQGLLSAPDLESICEALTAIGEEHALGRWQVALEQEDCQTAIENLLTARIGAAGGRLHAGRSRNDQVLAALRLYLRDAAEELRRGAGAGGGPAGWAAAGSGGGGGRARCAGCAPRRDGAPGLHPYAAGHAEQRRAVGAGFRRGDSRRCRGSRAHAEAHR